MKLTKTILILSFFASGCADTGLSPLVSDNQQAPNGAASTVVGGGTNSNGTTTNPSTCAAEVCTADLQVQPASSGANLVFVIDDSSSMGNKISKVVSQVSGFLSGLQAGTGEVRLLLVFDYTQGIFGNAGSKNPNPFAQFIDNKKIFYIKQTTDSLHADLALFRALALSNFQQAMPSSLPLDNPLAVFSAAFNTSSPLNAGLSYPLAGDNDFFNQGNNYFFANAAPSQAYCSTSTKTYVEEPTYTASECFKSGNSGIYFRPRSHDRCDEASFASSLQNACFKTSNGTTLTTMDASDATHSTNFTDIFVPGNDVNVVVFSDDDTNVNTDPTHGGNPDIAVGMLKGLFSPLGNVNVYYDAIVGHNATQVRQTCVPSPSVTCVFPITAFPVIDDLGVNHTAISVDTGGVSTSDIEDPNYSAVFNNLQQTIIYASQTVALPGDLVSASQITAVLLNGSPVDPSNYIVNLSTHTIQFKPAAFAALPANSGDVSVEIDY